MPQVKRQASDRSSASRLLRLRELPLRRLLLAIITVGLLFFSLWARVLPPRVDWQAADTADRTIKAPRSAVYTATEATSELREEVAAKVTEQYSPVADAEAGVRRLINEVFSQALEIHQPSIDHPDIERMAALRKHIVLDLSEATLRTLLEKPPAALDQIKSATQELASSQMQGHLHKDTDDLAKARRTIAEQAQQLNLTPAATQAAAEIAQLTIKPNLVFDRELTEQERSAARQAVEPIERTIQAGEIIITEGETVTSHHMDIFRAVGLVNPVVDYSQALGILTLLAVIVAILWACALRFTPSVYGDIRQMSLLSVVVIAATLIFRISQQSSYFEAIVLATATAGCMVIALATRPVLGSFLALLLGPLVGLATPSNDVRLVAATIICGLFAANVSTIRGSWTRTITRAAVMVAVGNALVLVIATAAFDLTQQWHIAGVTAVGGVAAALLSIGVIVVLEGPLQLLTDLRLMELSNPNEPILRQLRREAPASYQSSIMVANLAEQAAEAIGANSLLAHTAAMYHDIGKIKRPYF
ncbi:MAG: HDIG domain-containing protein, partial [Armatimonadetes bacterium]|nr:HDIG domain-containing protein [Armatimonadota bacterium]